jgi:hypothetical protein
MLSVPPSENAIVSAAGKKIPVLVSPAVVIDGEIAEPAETKTVLALDETAVIEFAAKFPLGSRSTMVLAELAENAVVLALDIAPKVTFEALSPVRADPLPDKDVNVPKLAVNEPSASLATIVFAPLAELALDVTVNVLLPDWFAVNVADPDIPVPDVFMFNVPSFAVVTVAQV